MNKYDISALYITLTMLFVLFAVMFHQDNPCTTSCVGCQNMNEYLIATVPDIFFIFAMIFFVMAFLHLLTYENNCLLVCKKPEISITESIRNWGLTIDFNKFNNEYKKKYPYDKYFLDFLVYEAQKAGYVVNGMNISNSTLIYINTKALWYRQDIIGQIISHEIIENLIDRILANDNTFGMEAWHIFAFDLADDGYLG